MLQKKPPTGGFFMREETINACQIIKKPVSKLTGFPLMPHTWEATLSLLGGEFRVRFHAALGNIHTRIFLLIGYTQTKQSVDDQPHHQ